MASASTDDTLVFSMHNRIAKVEFNNTQSTRSVRAFTITDICERSNVQTWRVEYDGAAGDIDSVFHQLKGLMGPYADLRESCDTLSNVLRVCQQIPRLQPPEAEILEAIGGLIESARGCIGRAALVSPLTVQDWEIDLRRSSIMEATRAFEHAAASLNGFLNYIALQAPNIMTARRKQAQVLIVNKTKMRFGVVGKMFEEYLFI